MRRMLVVVLLAATLGTVPTPVSAETGSRQLTITPSAPVLANVQAPRAKPNRISAPTAVVPGEAITVTGRQKYGKKRLVSLQRRSPAGWVKGKWKRANANFRIGTSVPAHAVGSVKYRVRVRVTKKVRKKVRGHYRTVKRTKVHTVAHTTVPVVRQRFTPTTPAVPQTGKSTTFSAAFSVLRRGRPIRLEEYRNGTWAKVVGGTQSGATLSLRVTTRRYPVWYRITAERWRGMKAKSSAPVLTKLRRIPEVVSHRAGAGVRPENTLPSLRKAIAEQPAAIEFDVQMSKDGVPFIMHDLKLTRTTDIAKKWPAHAERWGSNFNYYPPEPDLDPETGEPVPQPPIDEPILSQLDAGYLNGKRVSTNNPSLPYKIPTLDEWIATANGQVKLQLEVKHSVSNPSNDAVWAALSQRLQPGGNLRELNDQGLLIVSAFEQGKLKKFKLAHPDVPVAAIQDPPPTDMATLTWIRSGSEDGYLNMPFARTSRAQYAQARSLGFVTSAWTARTLTHHQQAIATGADRIVSDDLRLFKLAVNPPKPG